MSLFRILVGTMLILLTSTSALPVAQESSKTLNANPLKSKPGLRRIFRSMAELGEFAAPIPIPGGQRIVASVTGGQITAEGSDSVSGIFKGGLSVIDIANDGQSIVNNVRTFGTTTDGVPFLITESGLGTQADDFARLVRTPQYRTPISSSATVVTNRSFQTIDIGGKYAPLVNQFIVTEAVLATDRKAVMTVGYLVTDK
ncbi:MAG: hypothetical protein Q9174_002590 [Haloplaca sp. 1 TL-2023]